MKYLLVIFSIGLNLKVLSAADVLYLGDSLSANGRFGREIVKGLQSRGSVRVVAACGASPFWFQKGGESTTCGYWDSKNDKGELHSSHTTSGTVPLLTSLIEEEKPKHIVVQLGTNMLTGPTTDIAIRSQLRRFMLDIQKALDGGATCTWIGPPNAENIPAPRLALFYKVAAELLNSKCPLIDSASHTKYQGVDGLHFLYTKRMREEGQDDQEQLWIDYTQRELRRLSDPKTVENFKPEPFINPNRKLHI